MSFQDNKNNDQHFLSIMPPLVTKSGNWLTNDEGKQQIHIYFHNR